MSKSEIREQALRARRAYARALAPEAREALEEALAGVVLPHLIAGQTIAAYAPMRDEIGTGPLLDRLNGHTIAMPWFAGRDSRMLFRAAPATETGPWGIGQPGAEAALLSPDIVLVPLVTADRRGTRIGHGQGHYDRALAHLRAAGPITAIGLGWEPQISPDPLPADPWDVPLDAIATPAEWIDCRRQRADLGPRA